MIKLIASDLDGTLLSRDEDIISEKNRSAILSALSSGTEFAVISGRDVPSLRKMFSFASDKPFYVGCNGSVCVKGGKVIYSRPIPDTTVIKALKYANEAGKNVVLCAADAVYIHGKDCFQKHVSSLYRDGESAVITGTPDIKKPIYKISFFTPKGETGVDFSDFGVRLSYNKNGWTEYVNRFADKGAALSALQSHLGILKAGTASLGDSLDDCDMFAHSHISFAFGEEAENAFPNAIPVKSFSAAYEMIAKEK